MERNYHIFYQLCASASLPELQGLGLGKCLVPCQCHPGKPSLCSQGCCFWDSLAPCK